MNNKESNRNDEWIELLEFMRQKLADALFENHLDLEKDIKSPTFEQIYLMSDKRSPINNYAGYIIEILNNEEYDVQEKMNLVKDNLVKDNLVNM